MLGCHVHSFGNVMTVVFHRTQAYLSSIQLVFELGTLAQDPFKFYNRDNIKIPIIILSKLDEHLDLYQNFQTH